MKKVFELQQENKHPDRVIDATKHEVRKYVKRERKKELPEGATYWDFDCRFGKDHEDAKELSIAELIASLDIARDENWEKCYIEVLAKAVAK